MSTKQHRVHHAFVLGLAFHTAETLWCVTMNTCFSILWKPIRTFDPRQSRDYILDLRPSRDYICSTYDQVETIYVFSTYDQVDILNLFSTFDLVETIHIYTFTRLSTKSRNFNLRPSRGAKVLAMTTVIFEKHMTIIEKLPNYDTENEILDLFICFSSFYYLELQFLLSFSSLNSPLLYLPFLCHAQLQFNTVLHVHMLRLAFHMT